MNGIMRISRKRKGVQMRKILLFLVAISLSACVGIENSNSAGSKAADNINFYQHWVHAYEEQNGTKTPNIFRLAGSKEFPPSRFRMEFGFDPNGQCHYKFLSPDDRHEMRGCVYTKIDNKVFIYNDAGKLLPQLSFTLIEPAQKDIIRITYGVQSAKPKKAGKNVKS